MVLVVELLGNFSSLTESISHHSNEHVQHMDHDEEGGSNEEDY
jgi:hypothetical protein